MLNKKLINRKKDVSEISANKKFRNKTTKLGRNKINNIIDNCFSEEGRIKYKNLDINKNDDIKSKTTYVINNNNNNNKRKDLTNYKTQRIIDKIKFPVFAKTPNNVRILSPNNFYKNKYYNK